jgi:hypothetical protein
LLNVVICSSGKEASNNAHRILLRKPTERRHGVLYTTASSRISYPARVYYPLLSDPNVQHDIKFVARVVSLNNLRINSDKN